MGTHTHYTPRPLPVDKSRPELGVLAKAGGPIIVRAWPERAGVHEPLPRKTPSPISASEGAFERSRRAFPIVATRLVSANARSPISTSDVAPDRSRSVSSVFQKASEPIFVGLDLGLGLGLGLGKIKGWVKG